jgi:RNA polymerase sigma factor (sigma-70 family)
MPDAPLPLDRIDWKEVRALMRRIIGANVQGMGTPEDVEDLVQEACVKLHFALARGGIRDFVAIQVTIAKRTAIDFLRRRGYRVREAAGASEEEGVDIIDRIPVRDADPVDEAELEWFLSQVLRRVGDKCRVFFEHWMHGMTHEEIAIRLKITANNSRQWLHRCRARVRELLLADDGPLGDFAREWVG